MATQPAKSAAAGVLELERGDRRVARPLFLDPGQALLFARWLMILNATGVPYVIGGAYSLYGLTGVWRDTKDLDAFVEPRHVKPALEAFRSSGFETEIRDPYWLAKVHSRPHLFDFLFAVRHMTTLRIDERWLETGVPAWFLGVPTRLLGPEELIASKAYIASRDRFDGADIIHVILSLQGRVDWEHLVGLLGGDEEIVLWHLLLFQFVYPGHRDWLPHDLMRRAFDRARSSDAAAGDERGFRGMLLDSRSFETDASRGYRDARRRRPLLASDGSLL